MNPDDALRLTDQLTARDLDILRTLRTHRLATTSQLRRLHVRPGKGANGTGPATRSTQRVLARLETHQLTARLYQRVGGVRRGADSTVWQLAAAGDRLLSQLDGDRRRRYLEPGRAFIEHTLAVTELATQLHEAVETGKLDQAEVSTEPANWRRFSGIHGTVETLKPDLNAVTVAGDFEDHWFLELDRSTEHIGAITRKAMVYQRYATTGAYQDRHHVFPAVLWVVPDDKRRALIESALSQAHGLTEGIHRAVTEPDFISTVLAGSGPPPPPPPSKPTP